MRLTFFVLTFLLITFCSLSETFAKMAMIQGYDPRWLGVSKEQTPFVVRVVNRVQKGCWKDDQETKSTIEAELKEAGYKLSKTSNKAIYHIILTGVGTYKESIQQCVLKYDMSVWSPDRGEYNKDGYKIVGLHMSQLWMNDGLAVAGREKLNLAKAYIVMVRDFMAEVDRKKKKIINHVLHKTPTITPEAKAYWSKMQ